MYKEGKLLYDSHRFAFADLPKYIDPEELHTKAEHSWKKWMGTAETFLKGARFFAGQQTYKMAAFMLHQAVEHALIGMIQVCTGYNPATHNIDKLFRYANTFCFDISVFFNRKTLEESNLFSLLHDAYIKARYKEDYHITSGQVEILLVRIEGIHAIVNRVCKERVGTLQVTCA